MSKYRVIYDKTFKRDDWARASVHADDQGWLYGCIITPLGIVSVSGRRANASTWQPAGMVILRAVHGAREYCRRITPCPSMRGIATMAHRWLKKIVTEAAR